MASMARKKEAKKVNILLTGLRSWIRIIFCENDESKKVLLEGFDH
jgi:hypothetical protein